MRKPEKPSSANDEVKKEPVQLPESAWLELNRRQALARVGVDTGWNVRLAER